MTLATQMTTDLAAFFATDDFAVAATFTDGSVVTTINVIFDDTFQIFNAETGRYETSAPQAHCKTADVSAASHGDTLAIGGVTYKIIGIQPSEDALVTVLVLSKD